MRLNSKITYWCIFIIAALLIIAMGISYSVSYIQILAVFPFLIIALAFFRSSEKKVKYFRDNPEEAKREIEKVKKVEQKDWEKDHPILSFLIEVIITIIFRR